MKQMPTDTVRQLFEQIIGEQLGAVTFVQDYVQLAFDGPGITALTPITVVSDGFTVVSGDDTATAVTAQAGRFQSSHWITPSPMTFSRSGPFSQGSSSVNIVTHWR